MVVLPANDIPEERIALCDRPLVWPGFYGDHRPSVCRDCACHLRCQVRMVVSGPIGEKHFHTERITVVTASTLLVDAQFDVVGRLRQKRDNR